MQTSLVSSRANLFAARRVNSARRSSVSVHAAARPTWYPGAKPPSYLDGSLAGDYGFDPLRLAANPGTRSWLVEGEKYNGRWAMAAVAGILFTDAVGIAGPEGKWWEEGKYALDAGLPLPLNVLIAVEIAVFAILEGFRYSNFKKTGTAGFLTFNPFDPLGLNSPENEVKEVKNGRLAMLAVLGFSSQAAVQGLGPIECLKLHLENPQVNNIFNSKVGLEATGAVIALTITPIIIEAKNALSTDDDEEFKPIPFI